MYMDPVLYMDPVPLCCIPPKYVCVHSGMLPCRFIGVVCCVYADHSTLRMYIP